MAARSSDRSPRSPACLTLRVILHTLFGDDLEAVPDLHERVLSMLEVTHGTGLVLPVTRALPPSRAKWHRFLHDRAVVDSAISQLIADRRARSSAGTDTLDTLLAATDARGAPLPDTYIRDSLMSLILAGHETTAGALSWALQLLAHDHRAQDTLAREVHNEPRPEYLRATVQEVLRHRPVFLFAIPRDVASPMHLHDWTYVPPVQLLVCIYLIHHDPALFAKPTSSGRSDSSATAPARRGYRGVVAGGAVPDGGSRSSSLKQCCQPSSRG